MSRGSKKIKDITVLFKMPLFVPIEKAVQLYTTINIFPMKLLKYVQREFKKIVEICQPHSDILSEARREYWMIYRGPGFFAVL